MVENALAAGGLKALEITLRRPVALDCIRAIASEVPEAVVGAGTVLDHGQMRAVKDAGARFAVSPGASTGLLEAAAKSGIAWLPGAVTASEVMELAGQGLGFLKFFPAVPAGGSAYLASLASVFPHVKFCPTGGISLKNARDYLGLSNILCVGGSWVCPKDKLAAGDWAGIEALAREAAGLRS